MGRLLRTGILIAGFSALSLATCGAEIQQEDAADTVTTVQAAPTANTAVLNQAAPVNYPGSAVQLTPGQSVAAAQRPLFLADAEPPPPVPESDEISLGEDFTKPQRRIDFRLQYEDIRRGNDRYTETTRVERPFALSENWELGLRADVPVVVGNDAFSSTTASGYYTGLGDVLTQVALVETIGSRFKWGFGTQLIFPTATEKEFGDGKYRAVPTAGARYALPEISKGSYFSPLFRYDVDYAGRDDRKDISSLEFAPELNLKLARDWYIDFFPSTDIRYNCLTQKWFVPIDVQIGKRITPSIIASLEGSYGIIKDYNYYNFKVEFRIGFFY